LSYQSQFTFFVNRFPDCYTDFSFVKRLLQLKIIINQNNILKMTKLLFFLSILLLSVFPVFSKNQVNGIGIIKGVITTSDNLPAASVTVQLKAAKKTAITNEKGEFVFTNVAPGKYEVEVTSVGYTKSVQEVIVEADKTATISFHLTENVAQLTEVLVSTNRKSYIAAKSSTSLRLNAELIEIPQNITIATKQTLTDMGLLTKSEIFRISSAITKSYGEELDLSFQIRGMDATYGTYRNGVGGPIWWNAQEDGAMIERMEFVKGPAGFMLANAEPGGLVNVVTKQPTHQKITEVGFGVGSWNMMRTHIDLGGEFKKEGKLTYRLNAGAQKKNEYYQFGDFYRYWICPVLKYDFNKNTSLTVEHNSVKAAALANSQYGATINGDFNALPLNLAIVDPNLEKFWGADVYTRAHVKHKINDNWAVNAQAAYMTTDWDGLTMYPEGISPTKDTIYRYLSSSDWFGKLTNMQIFADGKFYTGRHAEHKVLIGVDYGDGSEGSTYNGNWGENKFPLAIKNPTYYLPKDSLKLSDANKGSWLATNKWQALYIQDHLKLYDKLIVTLAGRFTRLTTGQDYNSPPDDLAYEITDNKFTPRLGLTYMFSKNVSAYIMHDESFLAQRGAVFGGGRLPALTGSNNEIGIKALLFNKQLSITASVYDMKKNDVGTTDQAHSGFYLKTGQIRSRGMDLDIAGRINENIYVNINYAYVDPKITKDEDKTFVGLQNAGTCKNLANVWIKYQITDGIFKGLGVGAGYQYTDKRSAVWPGWNSSEGNKYLPAYSLFDGAISYSTGKFSINLNAYNLANVRYATGGWWYPDPVNEFLFYQGRPRNFRLQTTFRL
jgi:iron complex outermembrane recepter protein